MGRIGCNVLTDALLDFNGDFDFFLEEIFKGGFNIIETTLSNFGQGLGADTNDGEITSQFCQVTMFDQKCAG